MDNKSFEKKSVSAGSEILQQIGKSTLFFALLIVAGVRIAWACIYDMVFSGSFDIISLVLGNAIPIVIFIGLYKFYRSCAANYVDAGGISMVWVAEIIQTVGIILLLSSVVFLVFIMNSMGLFDKIIADYAPELSISGNTIMLVVLAVSVIAFGICGVFYFVVIKCLKKLIKIANDGMKPEKITMFLAVMLIIIALFSVFTAIISITDMGDAENSSHTEQSAFVMTADIEDNSETEASITAEFESMIESLGIGSEMSALQTFFFVITYLLTAAYYVLFALLIIVYNREVERNWTAV